MKILNFGSCNIDYVYTLDHIVQTGETETTQKLEFFAGGKGLNQSIATAKAGAYVYHAGCVGNDGEMLTDILQKYGVDISCIKTVDAKNGHAVIQVSLKGQNSIFLYPGSNFMVTKEFVDEVLKNFTKGDIILLQNEISNVKYIVEQAFSKGMTIIFNPSPFNREILEIDLKMISYLILNEVEAKGFSNCDNAKDCLKYFETNFPNLKVMLTLGENGCIYFENGQQYYQSAFDVVAVDTTAAGDTFTGYFVSGISKGEEITRVLEMASAASAISVTISGAAPSIPDIEAVKKELKNFRLKKNNIKTEDLLQKIENYMAENLKTATLTCLAKQLGYTEVYTGKLVKKTSGFTFSELLQRKRCDVAAKLLVDTNLSIKEIIEQVGYQNESFFRKIFKQKYDENPLKYRNRDKM